MAEPNDDASCCVWIKNHVDKSKHIIYNVTTIIAVALAIAAVLLVKQDEANVNKSGEIQSLRAKIKPCLTNETYPIFLQQIHQLTSKIEAIKRKVIQEMGEIESLLENNTTEVEASLNKQLTVVQSQISDLKTNVDKLQSNFGSFRDLTNANFELVWNKFDEIEAEIAKKRGKN